MFAQVLFRDSLSSLTLAHLIPDVLVGPLGKTPSLSYQSTTGQCPSLQCLGIPSAWTKRISLHQSTESSLIFITKTSYTTKVLLMLFIQICITQL